MACSSNARASAILPHRVYAAHRPGDGREIGPGARLLVDAQSAFENGKSLLIVPLAEVCNASAEGSNNKAVWKIDRLGDAQPFCADCDALGKGANLGQAPGQVGPLGQVGPQGDLAGALVVPLAVERRHRPPVGLHRPVIVTLARVGIAYM
jgi:hypothetical protein